MSENTKEKLKLFSAGSMLSEASNNSALGFSQKNFPSFAQRGILFDLMEVTNTHGERVEVMVFKPN